MSGLLYIAEIDTLGHDATGRVIMSGVRPLLVRPYSVLITNSPQLSAFFGSQTRFLELHCDVECWFDVGRSPSPVTTAEHLGAGERIFYPLRVGVAGLRIGVLGAAP